MRKLILFVTAVLVSAGALAETEKIDTTMYAMITEQPTQITLPNGSVVAAGWENSARLIAADGEESVQYCQGDGVTETDGTETTAGFCAVVFDSGDILWVWFRSAGPGSPGEWGVIAGTGEYAGATGGGTTQPVSQRGDGFSGTSKSSGSITTK